VLRDATGEYETSLACFAVLSGLSMLAAILATPPTIAMPSIAH
jgi:hypothetical protein